MSDANASETTAPEDAGPEWYRDTLKRKDKQLADIQKQLDSVLASARARAFDDAGVPEDKWGAKFRELYDGEIDVKAIKGTVADWGFAPAENSSPPASETAQVDEANAGSELEALAQAQALRGQAPANETADPLLAELQKLEASGDYSTEDIERVLSAHDALMIEE